MQKIDDLREILTAIQDIGNAWQAEIIKLRKDRDDLLDENEHLRETRDRLTEQNKLLRQDINNLSEKTEQLIKDLRDDLIKELDSKKQEEFQRNVTDCLKRLKASNTPTTKADEPKPSTPSNRPY